MSKKMSKADKVMLTAVVVIALFAVGTFIIKQGFKPFAIVDTTSLKQDYTPISLDNIRTTASSPSGQQENDNWIWSGYYLNFGLDSGSMSSPTGGHAELKSKHNFYGQEVALLIARGGGGIELGGQNIGVSGDYPRLHIVVIKPHTLDYSKADVTIDGVPYATWTNIPNPAYLIFYTQSDDAIQIQFIGYKAQFSCDIGANERWIETQWIGSVNVDDVIKKDGLIPTKYCKETRPFVLRDLQQGETAIFPDPIPAFNRGERITSPSPNQLIIVRYATYQVAGLENPTDSSQAYRCTQRDSNYKCLNWQVETVIKPVEVVVQCQQDSDCPLPLTQFQNQECLSYFKGCQSNKCVYDSTILEAVKCQNQVVTIVKQIEEIEKRTLIPVTGINTFTFTQNKDRSGGFSIGDEAFTASIPQFTCTSADDVINVPNPSPSCWKTAISYAGKSFELKDSQKVLIDSLISVQYFASGTWVLNPEFKQANDKTPFRNDNWGNTFVFTITLDNAFVVEGTYGESILKDSDTTIKFSVINNLPRGEVLIKINQKVRATNQNLPEQSISEIFNNGKNEINSKLNTQNPGLNDATIDIYYKIKADTEVLMKVASIPLTYNIVNELPSITKVVEVEKEIIIYVDKIIEKPIIVTPPLSPEKPLWAFGLFIVIVAGIGFLVWKRYQSKR